MAWREVFGDIRAPWRVLLAAVLLLATVSWSGAVSAGAAETTAVPVSNPDWYAAVMDTTLTVDPPGVLENDTDEDGDTLSAVLDTGVSHGTLVLDADGSFVYEPDAGYVGWDSFTYIVDDGTGLGPSATVMIHVLAEADTTAPTIECDADASYVGTAVVSITATDTESGVKSITYTLDDEDPVEVTTDTVTVTVGEIGVHTLVSYAEDVAGNMSDETTCVFEVYAVPPPLPGGIVRVAGLDRYGTAVEASKKGWPTGAHDVVMATGENWPDALGGSALAGAVNGPLLLTRTNDLPDIVADELERLNPDDIYILGGTGAVSPAVEAVLAGMVGQDHIIRLAGLDRYGTAKEVVDQVIEVRQGAWPGHLFVATGGLFPDALAASPIAAARSWPITLANPNTDDVYVPEGTEHAMILGGTGAVSAAVEASLVAGLGDEGVDRFGGLTRYETAVEVANFGVSQGLRWDGVGVATGENFPDALSGGPFLAVYETVLLLTPSDWLHPATKAALEAHDEDINTVHILGGTGAVSAAVEAEIRTSAGVQQ